MAVGTGETDGSAIDSDTTSTAVKRLGQFVVLFRDRDSIHREVET